MNQLTMPSTGKLIKSILQVVFGKTTKFSVRSDHNSINVRWTDGPTYKEVMHHIGHMRAGHYPNQYLSCQRELTQESWRLVREHFENSYVQVTQEGSFRALQGGTYRWEANGEAHTSRMDWDRHYRNAVGYYDASKRRFIVDDLLNYPSSYNWLYVEPAHLPKEPTLLDCDGREVKVGDTVRCNVTGTE